MSVIQTILQYTAPTLDDIERQEHMAAWHRAAIMLTSAAVSKKSTQSVNSQREKLQPVWVDTIL